MASIERAICPQLRVKWPQLKVICHQLRVKWPQLKVICPQLRVIWRIKWPQLRVICPQKEVMCQNSCCSAKLSHRSGTLHEPYVAIGKFLTNMHGCSEVLLLSLHCAIQNVPYRDVSDDVGESEVVLICVVS